MNDPVAPSRVPRLLAGFGRALGYAVYLAIVVALFDVVILNGLLGFGYPHHFEQENVQRSPRPYVEFSGKPFARDHDENGLRRPGFVEAAPGDLRIAFFGGSTGYAGRPPIPVVVERVLRESTGRGVRVANYSVVSSNHRQHLHGLLEHLPQWKPDLVVFYGGYNETVQAALYDPRPGYPYNFFYRSEAGLFARFLMEKSAIIGEVDQRLLKGWLRARWLTDLGRLRDQEQPFSADWNRRVVEKYFETLDLASRTSAILPARFLALYQPYQVPAEFAAAHRSIRERIQALDYGVDVSTEFDALGPSVYRDPVHVSQKAIDLVGRRIALEIARGLGAASAASSPSKPSADGSGR